MRKLMALVILLCGAAGADAAERTTWCEGADRLAIESDGFYLNGARLPDFVVTDATEETVVAFEYGGRLFLPCQN